MRGIWIVGLLALAGCTQTAANKWVRTDGQSVFASTTLTQQFEIDRTICNGEIERARMAGPIVGGTMADRISAGIEQDRSAMIIARGCMAQRGYVLVPEAEVASKQAEFRQAGK
jgi:hypothetical protein